MSNTKYIFLDIDGTLFSTKINSIPDSAEKAMETVRRNGHKVFLCTGRSLAEVSQYLGAGVDGFIFGAGAMIYADGKRIYDHPLNREDVTKIKALIDSLDMGYSLEGGAGAYCSEKGYESLLWYFGSGENTREKKIENAMANATYSEHHGDEFSDHIYKICAFDTSWDPHYEQLRSQLWKPYILTKAMALKEEHFYIGEVTNGEINKATAVQKVLDHYHVSKEDAYAVGDSANDISMIEYCGTGIAMGNATPETKEAADYVTTDILDHGIRNAFIHFGLMEEGQI